MSPVLERKASSSGPDATGMNSKKSEAQLSTMVYLPADDQRAAIYIG
jgi:hypothetical protein